MAADSEAELDALAKGFRERTKREGKRFRLATDSECWFAVCLKSREHKDALLTAARLLAIGDKYLDGTPSLVPLSILGPPTPTERSRTMRNRFARAVAGVRRVFSRHDFSSGRGRS
ncbi:hypothetical protein ACFVYA_48680 [Amycolatopsis sp. NPDC058278]|uniref:hypothetical protein n=1 Tax=Amycolatopsis sp. NPDC058278 TaxID=3346417 RepID=UPI0036DF12A9